VKTGESGFTASQSSNQRKLDGFWQKKKKKKQLQITGSKNIQLFQVLTCLQSWRLDIKEFTNFIFTRADGSRGQNVTKFVSRVKEKGEEGCFH
jgi:hypothetical protein